LWLTPSTVLQWGQLPFALADWNGDGVDDIISVENSLQAWSGVDGTLLADGSTFWGYFLPIVADLDGTPPQEVTLQGGYYPVSVMQHDLTTANYKSTDDDRPFPYGALATCPGGPVLVEGSLQNPARLKATAVGGSSLGATKTVVLAGGKAYGTEQQARAASAPLTQLGDVSVASNLGGQGHPTALVGSKGGWLYAVNPCTAALDFAYDFGASVGNPVVGDTDGDGRDEIIVSAGDGYLYDLKNLALKPPASVWDIDPAHSMVDADIDDEQTIDSLSGKWEAVAGATGYEIAIVDAAGKYVSNPPWKKVDVVTQTTINGLPLLDGTKYFFAVRTLGMGGPSVDAMSDGVVVHGGVDAGVAGDAGNAGNEAGASPEGGTTDGGGDASEDGAVAPPASEGVEGGGCGCRVTPRATARDFGVTALLPLAFMLRRRRRDHQTASDRTPTRTR
jgi:hypothetical protein